MLEICHCADYLSAKPRKARRFLIAIRLPFVELTSPLVLLIITHINATLRKSVI